MKNKFDFIGTYTGKKLHFLNPHEDEICVGDIANALSRICRFNGQTNSHYSVAEHSVIMSEYIMEKYDDVEQALSALFHDASEAYICDVARPIKPHLIGYQEIEDKISECINKKYNIQPMGEHVKWLDHNIVRDEAMVVFDEVPEWALSYERVGVKINCVTPYWANILWLYTFDELMSIRRKRNGGIVNEL